MGSRGQYGDQASDDGQRECARGDWCRSYTLVTVDGHIQRRPARVPRAFCEADRADIGRSLRQMPGQYLHLTHELARTGGSGHSVRIPFGPRVPLRVDVDALMRLFTESLYCWHERVADAAHLRALRGEPQRRRLWEEAQRRTEAAAAAQAERDTWETLRVTLPVKVEVWHNWTARHYDGYEQGADHIVALAAVDVGRLHRPARVPLCWTPSRAHELRHVSPNAGDENRLPDCKACLRTARRLPRGE